MVKLKNWKTALENCTVLHQIKIHHSSQFHISYKLNKLLVIIGLFWLTVSQESALNQRIIYWNSLKCIVARFLSHLRLLLLFFVFFPSFISFLLSPHHFSCRPYFSSSITALLSSHLSYFLFSSFLLPPLLLL